MERKNSKDFGMDLVQIFDGNLVGIIPHGMTLELFPRTIMPPQ